MQRLTKLICDASLQPHKSQGSRGTLKGTPGFKTPKRACTSALSLQWIPLSLVHVWLAQLRIALVKEPLPPQLLLSATPSAPVHNPSPPPPPSHPRHLGKRIPSQLIHFLSCHPFHPSTRARTRFHIQPGNLGRRILPQPTYL